MPISLTKINLNQIVKFKPTEHGLKIMADNHNSYLGRITNWEKREPEFFKLKLDSNGFYSLQLHQFMNEFGSQLFAGCQDLVEGGDIYLVSGFFNGS